MDITFKHHHTRPPYYFEKLGWTHFVVNFIGPSDGQGIKVYHNGQEVASDTERGNSLIDVSSGRIVVGRYYTDRDERYASVQVQELAFFNKAQSLTQIQAIYNAA